MPQPLAAAADIATKIAKILGHEAVKVKPYGRHFLVQIDAKTYGVSFKSHTGR